jgi:hypothetical protein
VQRSLSMPGSCRLLLPRKVEGKLAQDETSNDMKREFDGARFGALFGTKVATDGTVLPLEFRGLYLAGSTRLQPILCSLFPSLGQLRRQEKAGV